MPDCHLCLINGSVCETFYERFMCLQSYEKQLREAKGRINSQQNEVEILKLELESR